MRARAVLAFNVRKIRRARGFRSSAALAEAAGLSTPTLARLESSGGWSSEDTIEAIAKTLKCEESALFLDPELLKPTVEQAVAVIQEFARSRQQSLEPEQRLPEAEARTSVKADSRGKRRPG